MKHLTLCVMILATVGVVTTSTLNSAVRHTAPIAKTFVPDMQRRTILNTALLGAAGVPVIWMGGAFLYFFVPPVAMTTGGLIARDANGNDVVADVWRQSHPYPERSLVQGLKGDAHYLIVKDDGTFEQYALNAVCTHLGCVVPWNRSLRKYVCPCHGSQYDPTGAVLRGPAPLPLALAKCTTSVGKIVLNEWTEDDFRTSSAPWWIR